MPVICRIMAIPISIGVQDIDIDKEDYDEWQRENRKYFLENLYDFMDCEYFKKLSNTIKNLYYIDDMIQMAVYIR